MAFTHLHVHTEYSLLDGTCRIKPMLSHIKSMGQTSVAITDHGNMFGAVEFYKEAVKQGIKPIIGCECYVASGSRFSRDKVEDKNRFHLTLLCKDSVGYKNLIKIVSESYVTGFYSKPRIDKELLKKHHEGIICLSGCMFGEISQDIINNNFEAAYNIASWYKSIFGDDFYLEIQNHFLSEQSIINTKLMDISKKLNIPLVATNDSHYVTKKDNEIQKLLIAIGTNSLLNGTNGLNFANDELYLKSEAEMLDAFSFCPQAVHNSQLIADKCNFNFNFDDIILPNFKIEDETNHVLYLSKLCENGFIKRYGTNSRDEYKQRMNYELSIINKMGYTDYYLIVYDFIKFAKQNGIPVGPGRGSGAASICAYCLGITDIDPMKYNLLFERFLNPERVSMPDFDIDFCFERRQEVIDYVTQKYGESHVAQIITFGTLAPKAAIKDIGRIMGVPHFEVEKLTKLIPQDINVTLDAVYDESNELQKLIFENETFAKIFEYAKKIEGIPRHISTHAAGIVITDNPIYEYVPLAKNENNIITQFTMTALEELGLLKIDFLGLRTLTVIHKAEELIKSHNPNFSVSQINYDDKNVFDLYTVGDTDGIFQSESSGIKNVFQRLHPESIDDITAVLALYRPGPMDSIPKYIENKRNKTNIKYDIPQLKSILDITNGCIVYQEQVMQICRKIAGYTLGRADLVRRAMAKKKHEVMADERHVFINGLSNEKGDIIIEGAIRRGYSKKEANDIFDKMISFASYAFNKAHAVCYAHISYQTAYLKKYFPCEFYASLLTCFIDNPDKISHYINSCSQQQIKIIRPNINLSEEFFSVENKNIIFSLNALKGIGEKFTESILSERKNNGNFSGLFDFCKRLYGKNLTKKAAEVLIKAGAFDGYGVNRRQMLESVDDIISIIERKNNLNVSGQMDFTDLTENDFQDKDGYTYNNVDEYSQSLLNKFEKEVAGVYFSGHPLKKYFDLYSDYQFTCISDIGNNRGKKLKIPAVIENVSKSKTKNGEMMCKLMVSDSTGVAQIVLYPKKYYEFIDFLKSDNIVIIVGASEETENDSKVIICEKILNFSIDDVVAKNNETKYGLFLKFDTDNSPQINVCSNLLSIFEGKIPVYFYFDNTKFYKKTPSGLSVDVNDVLLSELKKILGESNVILK